MLVYDADKAGLKATLRAWTQALSLGMDVKVAGLPQGEDPASLLLKSRDEFKNALKNSKHIIDYYLDILKRESKAENQTPEKFKKAVQTEVLPYVAAIDSAIERSNFISRISVQTGIYESDLREEADKLRTKQDGDGSKAANEPKNKADAGSGTPQARRNGPLQDIVIRRVAALITWLKSKGDNERADRVSGQISHILSAEDAGHFNEELQQESQELLFEAEVLFEGSTKLDKDIDELMFGLEERVLKDRLAKIMSELQIAEKKGDKAKAEELLRICQDISLKLSALNGKRNE